MLCENTVPSTGQRPRDRVRGCTHECAGGPFQNFYNLPRGVLGAGCIADDSKEHLITRGRVERLVLANEDFGLEEAVHGVRADKAVPGLGSAKDTAEECPGSRRARRVLLRPKATRPERTNQCTVLRNSL